MGNLGGMNATLFRSFLINVLDDENGISQEAYDSVRGSVPDDVAKAVQGQDGRVFLGESDAAELRSI